MGRIGCNIGHDDPETPAEAGSWGPSPYRAPGVRSEGGAPRMGTTGVALGVVPMPAPAPSLRARHAVEVVKWSGAGHAARLRETMDLRVADGWALVAMTDSGGAYTLVFRRDDW